MTWRNYEKDGVEHTFYVSRFLEFVDIGMKPAERRTSGLILGRVIYIRMETEPNAFAKHFFFFFFFFLLNPAPYTLDIFDIRRPVCLPYNNANGNEFG